MNVSSCPCDSEKKYIDCCESIINGTSIAKSPEQLMRSRYSAHVVQNIDYLENTMHGRIKKNFDKEYTEHHWFKKHRWTKLEIVNSVEDKVEFKAHYEVDGQTGVLHERSQFKKIAGKWYYVDGQILNPEIKKSTKIGRNDPCSCGSGMKYKKCCG